MAHKHSVYDTDAHLTIVPTSRKIIGAERIKLVRGDHNSSRVTFDIPRYVDGHDMAETSIVEIHYINISADGKNTNEDVYPADDVQISPESDDVVIFSWLISNNATKYAGTLSFMLCFKCLTGEVLDYSWRTDTAKGVHVLKSLDCTPSAVADITDILTVWEMKISDLMGRVESMEDAIDGKLDKATDPHWAQRLYGVDADGTQKMHLLRWQPEAYSVAQRGEGGALAVGTPIVDSHAITLGFGDGRYVAKVSNPYWSPRLYGIDTNGTQKEVDYSTAPNSYAIAWRGNGGALRVGEPIEKDHASTRKYVDDKGWQSGYVAGASEHIVDVEFESADGRWRAAAWDVYIPVLCREAAYAMLIANVLERDNNGEWNYIGECIFAQMFATFGEDGFMRLESAFGHESASSLLYENAISVTYTASRM